MRLRKLQEKDVPLIYEWMKDPQVNCFFRFDPGRVTPDTVRAFVVQAQDTSAVSYTHLSGRAELSADQLHRADRHPEHQHPRHMPSA